MLCLSRCHLTEGDMGKEAGDHAGPERPASPSRRALVQSGGLLAGAALTAPLVRAFAHQAALPDPTRVPGAPSDSLGTR
ncbi:MAG: hypothetical protein ACOVSI_14100, partial [Gemmatimonas sp.]